MTFKSITVGIALLATSAISASATDQIRIVGSSTVYPFSTVVAERFGRTTNFATPIVESTGTGGGFKLFCAGSEADTPSVANASRAIKSSEAARCAKNGVKDIIEVKIGYDGIVMANAKSAATFNLTTRDIFMALVQNMPLENGTLVPNPNHTWKDVNSTLPNIKIEVLGPPPTSGTRDAFLELAMEAGCKKVAWVKKLKKTDKKAYKKICHSIREDGAYIDAGENDNLIVQRLKANTDVLGIFGFSFLDQNQDVVKAAKINGIGATFENIADSSYPISRPLFFYVKAEHAGVVSGLVEFITEFTSDRAVGDDGYLSERGLIPMPAAEHKMLRAQIMNQIAKQ
ncbi:MAG: phosphate ABC transporter substrate-binding protein [Alphaproteobacteria bacterium]|nr:MAG: phosphate ABC transporter substrate-binding protein [Alphaproteobacteria bacterium]